MNFYRMILDIIFPTYCLSCKKKGEFLCFSCISKFDEPRENKDSKATSLFDYRNPIVKHALWVLKYKNKRGIAENLGKALYEKLLEEYVEIKLVGKSNPPIIVPIPISKSRKRKRGYNQSELLVRAILASDHEKLFKNGIGILEKIKNTEPQARIKNRQERLKNVEGVFAAKKNISLLGQTIFLIDDVTTTGATLKDATRALKSAGAKKVYMFTVAH
jgi:competence protein ComFC